MMQKRLTKSILCSLVVALAISAMSHSAFAQLQPAISPWMGMFDRSQNTGTLGPYLSNVRPRQDLARAYAAQQSQMRAQQQALQALQGGGGGGSSSRDFAGGGGELSGAGANMILGPPREIPRAQRNPAGYYQYLHYYPAGGLPRRSVPNFSQAR
jgi:uncharacterized membrane protein YgcG